MAQLYFHVLTLFPEMVEDGLTCSILGRAIGQGLIGLETVNIRDYSLDRHHKVDDYPYGGGAGMLMQAQPVYDAYLAVCENIRQRENAASADAQLSGFATASAASRPRVIYLSPQGRLFTQEMAKELASQRDLIMLCGHYEGVDERVLGEIVTDTVSIGDYVLTGGELPAMVMADTIARMVPGVLGNASSADNETFQNGLLEYPQYTRPEIWRGKKVPQVLMSGNHAEVEAWRLRQSEARTRALRPDLYETYSRQQRALDYLNRNRLLHADMLDAIHRGTAHIVSATDAGVLLREGSDGYWSASAADIDAGERLLSRVPRLEGRGHLCFLLHQEELLHSVRRRFGLQDIETCRQAVYPRKTPPAVSPPPGYEMGSLSPKHLETAAVAYHNDYHTKEYLGERIRAGRMIAATRSGELAGFVGIHADGSIGMLEVLPAHRRQGLGRALQARAISHQLSRGRIPYVHVIEGNEASMALQLSLGMKFAEGRLYWIS